MALLGGGLIDVTPPHSEGVLTSPFSTTNSSTTVAVAHPTHGLLTGQIVTYSHASAVGGLTISGPYTITVVDADNYTITAASLASTTAGRAVATLISSPLWSTAMSMVRLAAAMASAPTESASLWRKVGFTNIGCAHGRSRIGAKPSGKPDRRRAVRMATRSELCRTRRQRRHGDERRMVVGRRLERSTGRWTPP